MTDAATSRWRVGDNLLVQDGAGAFQLLDPRGAVVTTYRSGTEPDGIYYTTYYILGDRLVATSSIPEVSDTGEYEPTTVLHGLVAVVAAEPSAVEPIRHADLLARVLAHPQDDGARLVYADALTEAGDPRGELIRTQLALAACGIRDTADLIAADLPDGDIVRLAALLRRANALIAQHGDAWRRKRFDKADVTLEYRRGMLDVVGVDELQQRVDPVAFVRALDGSTVRSLRLTWASDALLDALAHQPPPHLRELTLLTPRLTDPALLGRLLASVPALTSFSLYGKDSFQLANEVLAPLQQLVELRLWSTQLERAGLDALARLPAAATLRRLEIHNSKIGDDIVLVLDGRFPALADVKLGLCRIRAAAFARSGLRIPPALALTANTELDRSLAPLLSQPSIANLERLDLAGNFLRGASIEEIARCESLSGLRQLRLDQAGLDDTTIAALANSASARLTELHLPQTGMTARGLATLLASDRHALEVLDCWPNDDARDGAAFSRVLAEAPRASSLRNLRLYQCQLADDDVVRLATSPHLAGLRRLVLANNPVGDRGARALAQLPRLLSVGLWDTHIRAAGHRAWLEAPALVELHVNAGSTSHQLDDAALAASLRARFHTAFTIGREPIRGTAVQVVFPGTPPLTHAIVHEVVSTFPDLLLVQGDDAWTMVRDPRCPDAGLIRIRFSHEWENDDYPDAGRDWTGIASIVFSLADQQDFAMTAEALAGALATRIGGLVVREERRVRTDDDD